MRTRLPPRTFRAGELAPWLDGLSNEVTQQGCRTLENFLVRKNGQASQRPGSYYVADTKSDGEAVLVPVTIDDDNSYVLEIGDGYTRFFNDHAPVLSGGTAYEITSPWSAADLSSLDTCYIPSEKALYIAHPSYAMRKLAWTSDASWALGETQIWALPDIAVVNTRGKVMYSDDLANWEFSKIDATGILTMRRAAYGKKTYIAGSIYGEVFTSEDLTTWVKTLDTDAESDYNDLAASPNGDVIWVQDRDTGGATGSSIMYVSRDDGTTWATLTPPNLSVPFYAVGYDSTLDRYRVAGTSVGAYTSNLSLWTTVTEITNDGALCVRCENNVWFRGSVSKLWWASSVTAPWTVAISVTGVQWNDVAGGSIGGANLWVAIAEVNSSDGKIYTSSNGSTWTLAASVAPSLHSLVYTKNGFYGFGDLITTSLRNYYHSDDGVTWVSTTLTPNYAPGASFAAHSNDQTKEDFGDANHRPANITVHEGRLILGGTTNEPSTLWGSKTSRFGNFYLGDYANNAWSYDVGGERNVDIQWVVGGLGGILVGTRSAEGILVGSDSEGITPNTAQFKWLSTFGSSSIQPVRAGNTVVFVQRGGEIVRGYRLDMTWQSPELTALADHIAKGGIAEIDHQEDPQQIVWFVRKDGQLLALTMDGQVVAWSRIVTDGEIESVAVVPTSSAEDEVWCIVKRTVGGATKRFVEYFAPIAPEDKQHAHYLDAGVFLSGTTTVQTVGSLTHLIGKVVDALVDGTRVVSGLTVAAAGTISLAPFSGTQVHAGLPFTGTLRTMRMDYGSPWGSGAGLNRRANDLMVWVHDSLAGAKFGPTASASESIVYDSSTTLNTQVAKVNFPGQWDRDNYIWCVVRDPRPFTLVAMAPDAETGDR